jgi:hypothetical protein
METTEAIPRERLLQLEAMGLDPLQFKIPKRAPNEKAGLGGREGRIWLSQIGSAGSRRA